MTFLRDGTRGVRKAARQQVQRMVHALSSCCGPNVRAAERCARAERQRRGIRAVVVEAGLERRRRLEHGRAVCQSAAAAGGAQRGTGTAVGRVGAKDTELQGRRRARAGAVRVEEVPLTQEVRRRAAVE